MHSPNHQGRDAGLVLSRLDGLSHSDHQDAPLVKQALRTEKQPFGDAVFIVTSCSPLFSSGEHPSSRKCETNQNPALRPFCSPSHSLKTPPQKTIKEPSLTQASTIYFFFSLWLCSFSTFLTIFCSSIRKARTILSRTQLPHLEPPYARWTVFLGLEI